MEFNEQQSPDHRKRYRVAYWITLVLFTAYLLVIMTSHGGFTGGHH